MADAISEFIKNYRRITNALEKSSELSDAVKEKVTKDPNAVRVEFNNRLNDAKRKTSGSPILDIFRNAYLDSKAMELNNYLDSVAAQQTPKTVTEVETVTDTVQPETTASTTTNDSTEDDEGEVIAYTYKKGDTFGQVLKDLGLKTYRGLWGKDGDVAYYTKQLRAQGIPGMVPIGKTIYLKKRPEGTKSNTKTAQQTTSNKSIGYQGEDRYGNAIYGS